MLTKKQLKTLRNEITLNSLFLKDYSNSLFIKEKTACNFFDSFIDDIYNNDDVSGLSFYDVLEKYDNIDNLYNYYIESCIDNYDPLLQDDYIAMYNINVYYAIVIHSIEYSVIDYVYTSMIDGYKQVKKITKNKIYYDKSGNGYIKVYKKKYYLSEFMKVDNDEKK